MGAGGDGQPLRGSRVYRRIPSSDQIKAKLGSVRDDLTGAAEQPAALSACRCHIGLIELVFGLHHMLIDVLFRQC